MRAMGFLIVILAVLIFLVLGNDWAGTRIVIGILGIMSLLGGLMLLLLPVKYAALINWFLKFPDRTIRILCAVGLAVGVLILILGFAYY